MSKRQEDRGRSATTGARKRLARAAGLVLAAGIVMLSLLVTRAAQAQQFSVIYQFMGVSGQQPIGGLIADKTGNLYGTTSTAGLYGFGTVFELPAAGFYTVLYSFKDGSDGGIPDLTAAFSDAVGNVYGSTPVGGIQNSACLGGTCGVIFKASPTGKEQVLYSFTGSSDGSLPNSALIRDSAGNVDGLAQLGGSFSGSCATYGCGVVFKLSKGGQETVLYTFSGGADGAFPGPGLVRDSAGNLYGSTGGGGASNQGTIFKLEPSGTETVLYSFAGGADGGLPGYLIRDAAGNLYGTTEEGGSFSCPGGCGVVFKVDPTGNETVLYSFTGGTDGYHPFGGLVLDAKGNLYSTTQSGGNEDSCNPPIGCGVIFKLTPTGTETVLHSFSLTDGDDPTGALAVHNGNIYGTTLGGGSVQDGVAYQLRP